MSLHLVENPKRTDCLLNSCFIDLLSLKDLFGCEHRGCSESRAILSSFFFFTHSLLHLAKCCFVPIRTCWPPHIVYSYMRPFERNRYADVAKDEIESDTPVLEDYETSYCQIQLFLLGLLTVVH